MEMPSLAKCRLGSWRVNFVWWIVKNQTAGWKRMTMLPTSSCAGKIFWSLCYRFFNWDAIIYFSKLWSCLQYFLKPRE